MRDRFYGQPLIQALWAMFIRDAPETIIDYLRFVRSEKTMGPRKFRSLMEEIRNLEDRHNMTIVPFGARKTDHILPINEEEQLINKEVRRCRRL